MYKAIALPGVGLNASIMKTMMGQLDQDLSKYIEIIYIDPFREFSVYGMPQEIVPQIAREQQIYRWGDFSYNMDADVDRLCEIIKQDKNIIGIIGFSQGAGVLNQICQRQVPQLKFALIFSSSGMKEDKKAYDKYKLVDIPTIITVGTRDFLELETWIQSTTYINPYIIVTEYSHRIPAFTRQERQFIVQFVRKQLPMNAKL